MNNEQEYIEAYFNKELEDSEKKQFEERCVADEAFSKDVAFYILSREAARQKLLEQKKEEWAKYEKDKENNGRASFRQFTIGKWLPYAAAACLILFVTGYFLFSSRSPHQLANKYIQEHLMQLSQAMNASKDSLEKGIEAYNNKDYKTALLLFEGVYKAHPVQSDALKYMGHVSLATGNYDKALRYFTELAEMKGLYSNPGMFLKAVTLLKRDEKGDKEQAKQLLQQVVNNREEGSNQAKEWLEKW